MKKWKLEKTVGYYGSLYYRLYKKRGWFGWAYESLIESSDVDKVLDFLGRENVDVR